MTGHEIVRELRQTGTDERRFIKWWRKENDFADYELLETFLANLDPDHEFEGFELLNRDQLWQELHRIDPQHVLLDKHHGKTVIRWQHVATDGSLHEEVFPYDEPSLMRVFEGETRGDTLC
jgi:hypothetical protein